MQCVMCSRDSGQDVVKLLHMHCPFTPHGAHSAHLALYELVYPDPFLVSVGSHNVLKLRSNE